MPTICPAHHHAPKTRANFLHIALTLALRYYIPAYLYDTVQVLARALSPIVAGGGKAFFAGDHAARTSAMNVVRQFELDERLSASGAVRFEPLTNNRAGDTTTIDIRARDLSSSSTGFIIAHVLAGNARFLAGSAIRWPGGGSDANASSIPKADSVNASVLHVRSTLHVRVLTYGETSDSELLVMANHAAADINRDLNLLPTRTLVVNATILSQSVDPRVVLRALATQQYVALIVGASFLHRLLDHDEGNSLLRSFPLPVVGYASPAVALNSTQRFPTFMRVGHSNRAVAKTLVDTFQDLGSSWSRFQVLYDDHDAALAEVAHALKEMVAEHPAMTMTLTAVGGNTRSERATRAETALSSANVTVIVPLLASPQHLCDILERAVERGMFSGKHQLVFADLKSLADRALGNMDFNELTPTCSAEALMAMDGMMEVSGVCTLCIML